MIRISIRSLFVLVVVGIAVQAQAASVSLISSAPSAEAMMDSPELADAVIYNLMVDTMGANLLSVDIQVLDHADGTIYNHPNETPNDGTPNAVFLTLPPFRGIQADSFFNLWANDQGGTSNPTIFSGSLGDAAGPNPPSLPIQLGSPLPPVPQNFSVMQYTVIGQSQLSRGPAGRITIDDGNGPEDIAFDFPLIPEPGALALLGVGLCAGLTRRSAIAR